MSMEQTRDKIEPSSRIGRTHGEYVWNEQTQLGTSIAVPLEDTR
jgi:hypothetical protein